MLKSVKFLFAFVTLFTFAGCTLSVDVKTPKPSSQKLIGTSKKQTSIALKDSRKGEDKKLSIGKINYVLKNMDNGLQFLSTNLVKEMRSRGINLKNKSAGANIMLNVKKYQIVNIRHSGFHPLWTYTMFSGDLKVNGRNKKVAFYWLADKTPIWSMDEVNDPCFNTPVSLMVKEVAAKINHHYFRKIASTKTVNSIVAQFTRMKRKVASKPEGDEGALKVKNSMPLKVLELGYTNNRAALKPLLKLIKDDDIFVRVAATSAIGMIGSSKHFGLLKKIYRSKDDIEKAMALKSIGDLGTPEAMKFMKAVKKSPEYDDQMFRLLVDLYI